MQHHILTNSHASDEAAAGDRRVDNGDVVCKLLRK